MFAVRGKRRLAFVLVACFVAVNLTACGLIGVSDLAQADVTQAVETPDMQGEFIPLFMPQSDESIKPLNADSLTPSSAVTFPGVNSFVWLPDDQGAAIAGDQGIAVLPTIAQPGTTIQAMPPEAMQTITSTTPSLLNAARVAAVLSWVSNGMTIQTLDTSAGAVSPVSTQSATPVTGLTLTPAGDRITYATFDRQLFTQRPGDDLNAQQWTLSFWLADLSYSPDASQLAGADLANFRLYFLDAASGEILRSLEWTDSATSGLFGIFLSPDWDQAAWVSHGAVQLMNAKDGSAGALLSHPSEVRAVAWSPDSRLLATGAAAMVENKLEPAVLIWNASSGELLNTLIQTEAVQSLSFSPDGLQLAVLTTDGSLQTWSVSR
jgi:WD40 repeat protein